MAKHRDHRSVIIPPEGVRAQTAPPEVWDEHSEVTPRAIEMTPELQRARDEEAAPRRINETKKIALAVQKTSVTTMNSITEVRTELKGDIARVEGKVDEHGAILGDLRETTGQISGQIPLIVSTLEEIRADRRDHSTMKVTAFQAEVEVDKARALADTEVRKTGQLAKVEVRKHIALKIIAGAGGLWAIISAMMLNNC